MSDKKPKFVIRPFDPSKDKPIDLGGGQYMTEKTRTVVDDSGRWAVVPSVWFSDDGSYKDFSSLSDDELSFLAQRYEVSTGKSFPRFNDKVSAGRWADKRSSGGGASKSILTAHGGKK